MSGRRSGQRPGAREFFRQGAADFNVIALCNSTTPRKLADRNAVSHGAAPAGAAQRIQGREPPAASFCLSCPRKPAEGADKRINCPRQPATWLQEIRKNKALEQTARGKNVRTGFDPP
jgi:hypothetical protein